MWAVLWHSCIFLSGHWNFSTISQEAKASSFLIAHATVSIFLFLLLISFSFAPNNTEITYPLPFLHSTRTNFNLLRLALNPRRNDALLAMKISQKSKGKHLNFHGHSAPPFFSFAPELNTTEKRSVMGNPKALTGRKGGKLEERENMPKIYWSRLATLKAGTRALSGRKKLLSSFSFILLS